MAAKGRNRNPRVRKRPVYAVEVEYGAMPCADDGLSGQPDIQLGKSQAEAVADDAERHEGVIKILAEGVHAYLEKKGLLGRAEADQNAPIVGPGSETEIPNE